MNCNYCKNTCVKKGIRNGKQRYKCKTCHKYQLEYYVYSIYNPSDDKRILSLNANSVSISGMSRILNYSKQTIIRRMLLLASRIIKPMHNEINQVYEVDEMWTFVGSNRPENYFWITYAINRETKNVIDVVIGKRTKENLRIVINKVKMLSPKKIITDKLNSYPNLITPVEHDTGRYRNNKIERANLTLRQHIKRLSRKTLSYSKSIEMLQASILLYFFWNNWQMGWF